jgi:2-(1,2-epoxy-1,2-dihydrophenyl)acetyl-CoA isomerase
MNEQKVLIDVDDGVATITLNRPEAMNAFADGMRERLLEALENFATDASVRCIVITGAGKAFCAGGDIVSMAALQDDNDTTVVEDRMARAARIVQTMRGMRQPIIAAVNGAAAGGGMNLALACDIRDFRRKLREDRPRSGLGRLLAPAAARRHGKGDGADDARRQNRGH